MITTEADEKIINIGLQILSVEDSPTDVMIRTTVRSVIETLRKMNHLPDKVIVEEDQLIRKIETLCNVYVPAISALDDKRGHQECFSSRRAEIQWRFWKRYERYLEDDPDLPPH